MTRTSTIKKVLLAALLLVSPSVMPVLTAAVNSVQQKEGEPLVSAFRKIEKTTGYRISYAQSDVKNLKAQGNTSSKDIHKALDTVIGNLPLAYSVEGKFVTVFPKKQKDTNSEATPKVTTLNKLTVRGKVYDQDGEGIPGVSVKVPSMQTAIVTGANGSFTLYLPQGRTTKLQFSFIGMKDATYIFNGKHDINNLVINMKDDATTINEVVVTGIYSRKKESFTGSSQTYNAEELKLVGNQNLIQSLKTLDPAFTVLENNEFGSDPNRLPDLEIRGKTSIVGLKETFGEDPNQPLFILDGFETTLQSIMDLSMDRIASVTVLKDAASTAIYGAKAANGVVVVETKAPEMGKLKFSYSGNFNVSWADLTDYNLMNAAEKLEFERLAGNFTSNIADYQEFQEIRYNKLLSNVLKGVDTYWLSEPLRTGLNQRHFISAQGGNEQLRYSLGVSYNKIDGVMKKSGRDILSGNIDVLYRVGKLTFSNKMTVNVTKHTNPTVSFSEYASANPYYPKYEEDGTIGKWLEYKENSMSTTDASVIVGNPMYNDQLNSYDRGESFGVRNNFSMEYRPWNFFWIRARLGLTKETNESENFVSPENTAYDQVDVLKKGSYSNQRSDGFSYDGDVTATYGQLLAKKHQINAVLGASIRESSDQSKGFSAVGFPEGNFTTPGFANQYTESGKPTYYDSKNRTANFYFNGGYSFDNRYLLDVNYRLDGSSVFGTNRKFSNTWAVGLAWNIHNEKFMKDTELFQMLKIRGSIGNPGNQNFGSYNTLTTYKFNNWMTNNFGTGLLIDAIGDPDLAWQKTIDMNVGLDVSLLNRLHLNIDVFHKNTDPLLASIGIPASVGVTSRLANIGKQVTDGFNGTIRYSFIYRPKERMNWTTSLSFSHVRSHYENIGSTLAQYNNENLTKNMTRYYDGGSPSALWAVRSAGIDPATGKEIFITKSGNYTFSHSYDDEVEVGDTRPDVEGVFGNVFYYKGFSASIYMRYSLGGDTFLSTLYDKVENISSSALAKNQDRRALYDRWQKPGDIAKFKGISRTESTPMSSRFVSVNNYLTIESIRVSYELPYTLMKKMGLQGMTFSAYMNDIARWATVKEERGTSYPFSRSISMALSLNF
ncbi:SusC/RagA family TonB-linked outer membrane protein [Prevotella sp. P2-180]|uniref:SusC/RagA family TonB-linked outer membrane protein n=1 Tax=Prevotella sp. P2-180 TaxID=2024224 RepID=UPI000B972F65|nr:SusC/RagA family TonB-linked outer membrane protein [Prevotella sp. P2-180]OYP68552.1 SusC/RagA family TonB-linked outer membrane protein [Prevotella sp. P2-180]